MQYSRKLGYEETPDYNWLRGLFAEVLKEMDGPDDGIYDWQLLNNGKGGWQSIAKERRIVRSRKLLLGPPPLPTRDQKKEPVKSRQALKESSNKPNNYMSTQDNSYNSKSAWSKFKSFMTCGIF